MQLLLPIARVAVAAGYNAVLFDYRGFGLSTGEPDTFSIVPDTTAVLEAVRRHRGTRRLALYGISLGSVGAVGAASERPDLVDAIVVEALFSPHTQLRKAQGGFVAGLGRLFLFPSAWNMESIVPSLPQPILLVHGDVDSVLPLQDSLTIYEEMPDSDGPRFLWVPEGAGHAPGVSARFGPDYDRLVLSFLDRWLKGAPGDWMRATWENGAVRLTPIDPRGGEPLPVEIAAITADGTPRVLRAWFDPARPAPIPFNLPGPPVFISAVVPAASVSRAEESWERTGEYLRSYLAWSEYQTSQASGLFWRFMDWKIPVDSDEKMIAGLDELWKKEGRDLDARTFMKENGLLQGDSPEGLKRRDVALASCAEAEASLRRTLDGPVDPAVLPRYADAAGQIAGYWDALGEREKGTRAWELRESLLPGRIEGWIQFGDASWRLGAGSWAVESMLVRLGESDPSREPAVQAWIARATAREQFLQDWRARIRMDE